MIEKKERGRTVVYTSLSDMISALEAGTELHIGIAFFPSARGRLSPLPAAQMIHSSPYCMQRKRDARQMEECYGIREKKLRRAKEQPEPFVSLCPCGITEYLHPVILRNSVVCLLMISGKTPKDGEDPDFLTSAQCKAKVLENHVQLLMEASPPVSRESDPFAAQAAELLSEGITEKLSVKELARSLGYHEKYFGAKFKQKNGKKPPRLPQRPQAFQGGGVSAKYRPSHY